MSAPAPLRARIESGIGRSLVRLPPRAGRALLGPSIVIDGQRLSPAHAFVNAIGLGRVGREALLEAAGVLRVGLSLRA